ncbi:MAG: hypothetical protein PF501_03020 [Salinisphaera sp.]|jgi:hypothetical protein|nr:hypothetical protein [Salinisphaera sp.]
MTHEQLAIALQSALGIALWCAFLFWLYPHYRIEEFRQRVFELRQKMFREAAAGRIDFNDPAYGMLRTTMNGMLGYAHELSVWVLLFEATQGPKETGGDYRAAWEKNVSCLEARQQKIIRRLRSEMDFETLRFLIMRSVVLSTGAALIRALSHVRHLNRKFSPHAAGWFNTIDSTAYSMGRENRSGHRHINA